jgi:hypothetical protein
MVRSRYRRACALVFAAVFLGSGFVLPDLDALLYHSSRVTPPNNMAHLEVPGGCGAHSERCALTLATPVPQLAPAAAGVGFTTVSPAHPIVTPVIAHRSANRKLFHPSRAPPAPAS